MKERGRDLMSTIGVAVKSMQRLDGLRPAVQALAQRQAGHGLHGEHYQTVVEALLWSLQTVLGSAFTPPVRQAWTLAHGVLSAAMKVALAGLARAA